MISSGSKIGPFQIRSLIGTGGMGEVYLADDTRLGRKVAVKLLRKEFRQSQDPLRRFLREAKSASALNHPNIITIYEIGEWEDEDYIAMEFVSGESVRDMIQDRTVELSTALDVAIQVSSALAAAHEAGIIHRDIKPENIIRRSDGLVKVLDFGLAKQTVAAPEFEEIDSEATTRGALTTIPGMIMGTAAYMSPEQARGKPTDARTDIWSLGVVLYEMVTGRTPFSGETRSDLLVSILTREPEPINSIPAEAARELQQIFAKALNKDRDERYQTVKDFAIDLKILRSELNSGEFKTELLTRTTAEEVRAITREEPAVDKGWDARWLWAVPAILVLAAALWYAIDWYRAPVNNPSTLISTQVVTWKSGLGEGDSGRPRFSPDGKLIAYVASKDGRSAVWLKQIGGGDPFTFKQDDSADTSPLWSSDGSRMAYLSNRGGRRGIWTAPALGGAPTLVSPVDYSGRLVHWSKDGSSIYYEMRQNLYSADIRSGITTKLTGFDEAQIFDRGFSLSPNEKRIAYTDRVEGQSDLWISDINGGNANRLTNDTHHDASPVWHPDDKRVIYNSERNGVRQIFVAYIGGGEPVQVSLSDSDSFIADVSADGQQILYGAARDDSDLWRVDLGTGRQTQVTSEIGAEFWPDASPNGNSVVFQGSRRAAIGERALKSTVFVQPATPGRAVELASNAFYPKYSPDGSQIAFLRTDAGSHTLWVASASGGDARALTESGVVFGGYSLLPFNRLQASDYDWAADGSSIIYIATRGGAANLWRADTSGGETPLSNNSDKSVYFFNPTFSPDGQGIAWLAMKFENPTSRIWSVWLMKDGRTEEIHRSDSVIRIVGWLPNGAGLLLKSIAGGSDVSPLPRDVSLFEIGLQPDGPKKEIAKLRSAYFHNIALSRDRRTLAYAAHEGEEDSIHVIPAAGGPAREVARGSEPRVYFSALTFSPDGRSLYYGRQANWQIISTINNFK